MYVHVYVMFMSLFAKNTIFHPIFHPLGNGMPALSQSIYMKT